MIAHHLLSQSNDSMIIHADRVRLHIFFQTPYFALVKLQQDLISHKSKTSLQLLHFGRTLHTDINVKNQVVWWIFSKYSFSNHLTWMTQTVFALCPLLYSSQTAWLCKLLSNQKLSGSHSPLCACLFAYYMAESSTKKPGFERLLCNRKPTVCHHNTCIHYKYTSHWCKGRGNSVCITDVTVWVYKWSMWVLLTKLYSENLPLLCLPGEPVSRTCRDDQSRMKGSQWAESEWQVPT